MVFVDIGVPLKASGDVRFASTRAGDYGTKCSRSPHRHNAPKFAAIDDHQMALLPAGHRQS